METTCTVKLPKLKFESSVTKLCVWSRVRCMLIWRCGVIWWSGMVQGRTIHWSGEGLGLGWVRLGQMGTSSHELCTVCRMRGELGSKTLLREAQGILDQSAQ